MSEAHPLLAVEEKLSAAFTAIENEETISEAREQGVLSPHGELDISENDEGYQVRIENVQLDPGEVYISIRDHSIVLWDKAFGNTAQPDVDENMEEAVEDDIITEEQMSYGNCMVEVPLPANVDEDGTLAQFMDGTLTVSLPKKAETEKRQNA